MDPSFHRMVSMVIAACVIINVLVKGESCKPNGGDDGGILFPRSHGDKNLCVTPNGEQGNCVLLSRCRKLWNTRDYELLRRSLCGFEGQVPKICCPVQRMSTALNEEKTTAVTSPIPRRTTSRSRGTTIRPRRPLGGRFPLTTTSTTTTTTTVTPLQKPRTLGVVNPPDTNSQLFPQECGKNSMTFRRIVGGQEAAVGSWPWMAAIYMIRRGIKSAECGGTLITKKHVVTAAHCMVDSRRLTTLDPKTVIVRLGDHDLDSDLDGATPIDVNVQSVTNHAGFNPRTFQNDISILELATPVEFKNNVAPICLPLDGSLDGDELADRNAFVAGWGTLSFTGPASSKLQEVQIRIWENEDCKEVFKNDAPITDLNVCAGDGDKDSCRGDSGGPLMLPQANRRFYLVGVVSFGKKCAEPGYPGVYARVTSFLDWIEETIRKTL